MQHWLFVRGTANWILPDEVDPAKLRTQSSSKRPTVQRGDLAVCYASGWQNIFAIVEVVGDPENDPSRKRWQWQFRIRPILAVRRISEAPPVEAAEVFPRSLGRHSHIRLTPTQFEHARDAIAAAPGSDPLGSDPYS